MTQVKIKKATIFSVANPEHAIASLRLTAPLSEAQIDLDWRMPHEEFDENSLTDSDVVVIQRDYPRFVDQYFQIHSHAHQIKIPVIFEIDDLLWELPEEHPDRSTHHYTDALLPMMFAAWAADGISVASPGIKDYLAGLNPNIFVLPNFLNSRIWSLDQPRTTSDRSTTIGYMGGDSHKPDLEMVEPAILKILDRFQDRVKFKIWGFQPSPRLLRHPQVEWESLEPGNYAEFADYFTQQEFDIYIAPLKDSLFNRCKSSIKLLEYTSLGITGVSSRLNPYREVINHGVTGFLADSLEQWEDHLTALIENPEKRQKMALEAQNSVRNDWLLEDHHYLWQKGYENIADTYSQRQDVPGVLKLMRSIVSQQREKEHQLLKVLDDKDAQINQLNGSISRQAGRALKKIFNRLLSDPRKDVVQESHDD